LPSKSSLSKNKIGEEKNKNKIKTVSGTMTTSNQTNTNSLSDSSLVSHKETLYLTFSPDCLPYAEVAAYLIGKEKTKLSSTLKLGLERDIYSKQSSLIVPAGSFAPDRVTLNGKSSILRYLSRQFDASLYGSLPLSTQQTIDDALDRYRATIVDQTALSQTVSNLVASAAAGTPQQPTLKELLAWDLARQQTSETATKWAQAYESKHPVLQKAAREIDALKKTVPVLDEFRFPIVKQLAALTGVEEGVVFPMLENKVPKDSTGSDFSIAIPRLKLPGSPAENAKNIVAKVRKSE
jgi:hypothetical protein